MRIERTAWRGDLQGTEVGREVGVAGWVDGARDHGGLLFVDLRDRSGVLQLVFDPSRVPELHERAREWRGEWSICSLLDHFPENAIVMRFLR